MIYTIFKELFCDKKQIFKHVLLLNFQVLWNDGFGNIKLNTLSTY